jgi:hypothetical protein
VPREHDHARATFRHLVDGDQLLQRIADVLLVAAGEVDVELFGVGSESLPVFGPEERL